VPRRNRAVALFGLAAGCAGVAGIDELRFDPAPTGPAADGAAPLPVDPLDEAGASVIPAPPGACPSARRRCVPKAPSGWVGPIVAQQGAALSPCPDTNASRILDAFLGAPTGSHSCSGCTCGATTGASCTQKVVAWSQPACGGTGTETVIVGTCVNVFSTDPIKTTATHVPGSCAPSVAVATLGPATFPEAIRGCIAPSFLEEGCAIGEVCAADPPAGYRGTHCVATLGDLACPSPYTVRVLAHGGASDDRACGSCSCSAPAGGSCDAYFTIRNGSNCPSSIVQTFPPGECYTLQTNISVAVETNTVRPGSCTPSGGGPTGSLRPRDPVTVCCLP
jgi:hypothetical protein